jgi:hypothetical protein
MKASLKVHPDHAKKYPNPELAALIFVSLNKAYTKWEDEGSQGL